MDANDQVGDCTLAAAHHMQEAWATEVGLEDAAVAASEIEKLYFQLTGGADSGLVEAMVLEYWRFFGLWNKKIVGYAPIATHDLNVVKTAIELFGGVYAGVQLPDSAETQFGNEPWSIVPGAKVIGGHAIPLLGYDQEGPTCVSWGQAQKMTWDWWQMYGDEAWAIIPEDFVTKGRGPVVDIQTLTTDLNRFARIGG